MTCTLTDRYEPGKYTEQVKTESEDACQFAAAQTKVSLEDEAEAVPDAPASGMQIRLYAEGEMED
jgi:hypothetical protein